jgi:hypothetical protein
MRGSYLVLLSLQRRYRGVPMAHDRSSMLMRTAVRNRRPARADRAGRATHDECLGGEYAGDVGCHLVSVEREE